MDFGVLLEPLIPASDSNDVGLAEIDLDNWKKGLDSRDTVIADTIFRPIIDSLQAIAGWKRQLNQPLEAWKKEENRQITNTRGNSSNLYFIIFYYIIFCNKFI